MKKAPRDKRGQFFPMETTGTFTTAAQNRFGCQNVTPVRNRSQAIAPGYCAGIAVDHGDFVESLLVGNAAVE
jgi:hypothetical protein